MNDSFKLTEKWQIAGMTKMEEKRKLLPVRFHSVGHFPGQKHVFRPNGYSSYQITVCLQGSGVFCTNGEKYEIEKGNVFFFSPGVAHEYYPLTEDWTTVWVVFDGEETDKILEYLDLEKVFVRKFENEEALSEFLQLCDYLYRAYIEEPCYRYEMTVTVMAMFNFLKDAKPVERVKDKEQMKGKLSPAVDFIKKHYEEDISLDEIAKTVNMSKSHFCRIFKMEYGITPVAYLINYRIGVAKFLLETTVEPVEMIVGKTGFNNASHFCSTFRKNEGMSPVQYRERHRG